MKTSTGSRVLVFAPSPLGGMAEHVHYQAGELARRGYAVTLLCRPDFVKRAGDVTYAQHRSLVAVRGASLAARVGRVAANVINHWLLAWHIIRLRPAFVLMEANSEYHALGWAWPHLLLRRLGVIYIANFHDPLRDRRWGPHWLHRWTLRLAYGSLHGGLIHGPAPEGAWLPARLTLREVPFGPFDDLAGRPATFDGRARLGIGADAFVVLAFGHIADRKNLDLVVTALAEVPGAHLIIAGPPGSTSDRPPAFYAELAARLGAADRVHLVAGFVTEGDLPAWFAAADAVALTYTRGFVSQSGVLQIAALWDRPLLASGGEGPLLDTVRTYGLGLVIEPDSASAIASGLMRLASERLDLATNFARYRASTSWQANVDGLLAVVAQARRSR